MRFESTSIARVSHRAGPIARKVAFVAAGWLVFGTVVLAFAWPSFAAVSFLLSFLTLLVASMVALAQRGGPALGVPRVGLPGAVTVDGETLSIVVGDRELSGTRRAIVSGFREEIGNLHQVILELAGDRGVCVRVRSAEEGEALLDACGVSAAQRAVTLRVGAAKSGIVRFGAAMLAVFAVLVAVPSGLGLCVALGKPHAEQIAETCFAIVLGASLALALSWNALAVRVLRIGRDGVFVRSSVFSQRFVSFDGLIVKLRNRRVRIGDITITASSAEEATTVVQRIEAARARHEVDANDAPSMLARNGRPLEEWQRELRALLRGPVDYRAPIDAGTLAAIVEDPARDAEQRIAAAVVLSTLPAETSERARLRIAIETTVEPELRVALERAEEGVIDSHGAWRAKRG